MFYLVKLVIIFRFLVFMLIAAPSLFLEGMGAALSFIANKLYDYVLSYIVDNRYVNNWSERLFLLDDELTKKRAEKRKNREI